MAWLGRAPDVRALWREPWVRVAVLVAAAQGVAHLVNVFTVDHGFLDVNMEARPFAILQALVIATAAFGALVAWRRRAITMPMGLALAGALLFLAVDEAFVIHERLGGRVAGLFGLSDSWDSVVWPLIYGPLGVILLCLLVSCATKAPAMNAACLQSAARLLVIAVVLEVVSAPFSTPTTADGMVHQIEAAFEESFELLAWSLTAIAFLRWHPCRKMPQRGDRDVNTGSARVGP